MLASEDRAGAVRPVWSQTLFEQLRLTEDGLVLGAGSILVRLGKGTDAGRAAVEANADRLVALMSVAAGWPLTPDAVLPHVAAAAEYWRRGEKALAHLRLAVARLPHLACAADAWRVAIAGHLLDAGMPPAALVAELWPETCGGLAAKTYHPEERRNWRGEWTDGSGGSPAGQSKPHSGQVAMNGGAPEEDEKHFQERERTGLATIGEEAAHGRAIDPFGELPVGVGIGPFAGKSVPAGPSPRPSPSQKKAIDAIGRATGCHTCGTTVPGGSARHFCCDHQPPTALKSRGQSQIYLPQCASCSSRQGGLVKHRVAPKK